MLTSGQIGRGYAQREGQVAAQPRQLGGGLRFGLDPFLAKQTGQFGWQALRAALDSSPLVGRGRVEDTWNLLGRALRTVVTCAAATLKVPRAQVLAGAGVTLLGASSLKAALDIDWSTGWESGPDEHADQDPDAPADQDPEPGFPGARSGDDGVCSARLHSAPRSELPAIMDHRT